MVSANVELSCETCCRCNVQFWISKEHADRLVKGKGTFYCPSGHPQSYTGKTDTQKLIEKEKENARIRECWDDACDLSAKHYDKWKASEKKLKKLAPPKKKVVKNKVSSKTEKTTK